ncbi:MAG: hypothetical protein P9F75_15675 [Candidatus Contendobacter sp.]|nr:hypothetical protein [Candidatus Contendobacter sp.]
MRTIETGQALLDEQSHPIGIGGFILDLTHQQSARQALTDCEKHLRGIGGAVPDALMMMDDAGRLVFWNTTASRVHGAGAYPGLKPRMRVNPCPAC